MPFLPNEKELKLPCAISRGRNSLLPILLSTIILIFAAPLLGQVSVEGKVRVEGGQVPGVGVNVRIETEDGEVVAQSPVSSGGGFSFPSIKKGIYTVVVTCEGYETARQQIDLTLGPNMVISDVTIMPSREAKRLVIKESRTDVQAPKLARKEYQKAVASFSSKDIDAAQAHLEKAVKEFPCYARAQTDLATVLEQKRDMTGAEAALRKAMAPECDPDYIDSYIILGQMLNSQKRFADSERVLEEGVRRSPGSWQFYYQLGVANFGLSQITKAESQYQKVLELNPSPPAEFHVKLCDVYLREKAYGKAYSEMEQYLKAEPDGRFAPKIKNIMQEMRTAGILNQPAAAKKEQ
ncbi:MAG TPA: tetratricopeptide repeat protein [Terriglobia bacterium]|nr:tetratricopeptide repeat protein [Terriglobia bacterium]